MNSLFYDYFSKILKWPLLQSRYLQVIVKGLARYMDTVRGDIITVRSQFIPQETELVDEFADSRGISRLPNETDDQFRTRMLNAYRWQKLAGKFQGLSLIFADFGYDGVVILPDSDTEKWAEFHAVFPNLSGDSMLKTGEYVRVINEFKPARSKLAGIRYRAGTKTSVYVAAVTKTKTRCIIQPEA